jgi:hypothetical protein
MHNVNTCAAVTVYYYCRYNCTLIGWDNGSSRGYSSISIHYVSLVICRFCSHFSQQAEKIDSNPEDRPDEGVCSIAIILDAARRPLQTFERARICLSVSPFQRDETRLRRPCAEDSRRAESPRVEPTARSHLRPHGESLARHV